MKICICCSLSFTKEVLALAKELEKQGFELLLPNSVMERSIEKPDFDPVQSKIKTGNVNKHIDKIKALMLSSFATTLKTVLKTILEPTLF